MDNHYSFPSYSAQLAQSANQGQHMGALPNVGGGPQSSTSQTLPSLSGVGLPVSSSYGHQSTHCLTSMPSHTPSSSVSSLNGFSYHQNGQANYPRTFQLPMPQPAHRPVEPSSSATTTAAYTTAAPPSYVTSTAPPTSGSLYSTNNLINIQPRPQETFGQAQNYQSISNMVPTQSSALYLPPMDTPPTHVVGQQGRRGVLASVSGKEAPVTAKGVVPQKAPDGKYHCEYCSRSYQHAKHLKRHHLRHTGERPYMCNLCSDTFSRSDILKRHYQKCAQRRGVPEGTDHLEGSRAHLTRRQRSRPGSRGNSSTMPDIPNYQFSDLGSATSAPYMNGSSMTANLGNVFGAQPQQHPESATSTPAEPMLRNDSHQQISNGLSNGHDYQPRSMPPVDNMTLGRIKYEDTENFNVPSSTGISSNNGLPAYAIHNSAPSSEGSNGLGNSGQSMDGVTMHGNWQGGGPSNGYAYPMANSLHVGNGSKIGENGRYRLFEQAISIP